MGFNRAKFAEFGLPSKGPKREILHQLSTGDYICSSDFWTLSSSRIWQRDLATTKLHAVERLSRLTACGNDSEETKHMKRSALVSFVTACFCLGLAAPALAAETSQTAAVRNPPASEKNDSATKSMPLADVPVWRQRQIAAARSVTSKKTPFRPDEVRGTEVRSPQNEALGSVENLVRSPATNKIAYLVIALNRSSGIDDISVPVPLEDFKITPNANLLVLDTTRGVLEAAPRVNPFSADGIDLQNHTVDGYWKAHLSNKIVNRVTK